MKNSSLLIIMITLIFCEDIQIINGYEYTQPEGFSFLTSFPKDIKAVSYTHLTLPTKA